MKVVQKSAMHYQHQYQRKFANLAVQQFVPKTEWQQVLKTGEQCQRNYFILNVESITRYFYPFTIFIKDTALYNN